MVPVRAYLNYAILASLESLAIRWLELAMSDVRPTENPENYRITQLILKTLILAEVFLLDGTRTSGECERAV